MQKHSGKFSTVIVTIIVIALLCGTGWLTAQTIKGRSIAAGQKMLADGNYSGALEAFTKADKLAFRPDASAVAGKAECYIGLEDYENARKSYEILVKLEPDKAKHRYMLGLLCIRAKDYEAAEKEIKSLRALGSDEGADYADALSEKMQTGRVKGFFRDLFKKIVPNLPNIPGLTEDEPLKPDDEHEGGSESEEDGF